VAIDPRLDQNAAPHCRNLGRGFRRVLDAHEIQPVRMAARGAARQIIRTGAGIVIGRQD
jgi:hypothetical protein